TLTAADGSVQKTGFAYLGRGIGSVTDAGDPPQVSGVFRTTPAGVEADYADGHSELIASVADGLSITLKNNAGEQACVAWYPQGHVFSADERRAAVAAYARRLGVFDAAPVMPHAVCNMQVVAPVMDHHAMPVPTPKRKPAHAQPASFVTRAPAPVVNGLQGVSVKDSKVHLIDGPSGGGDTLAVAAAGAPHAQGDEAVASNCLKVDSDGSYWGFRNHCSYTVQFAYCLLRGTNTMTACNNGAVSVPGSVSANGFGALFADDSLGERDVDHNFRWVGCKGGAGEVSAHLDAPEPATGHCVRAGRDLAQGN
ncbi:MAG TPA: hypothetical protein VG387_00250, partial [Rhizomicrobium sp.]|nr:hypothetical protein [Rhizomicrobium sp.]